VQYYVKATRSGGVSENKVNMGRYKFRLKGRNAVNDLPSIDALAAKLDGPPAPAPGESSFVSPHG
jgi:hypothetical protein